MCIIIDTHHSEKYTMASESSKSSSSPFREYPYINYLDVFPYTSYKEILLYGIEYSPPPHYPPPPSQEDEEEEEEEEEKEEDLSQEDEEEDFCTCSDLLLDWNITRS
jgi:hypothetical protein